MPVARDLSDLVRRVRWARKHDEEAKKIAENARKFANDNLLPQHIICYHAVLFSVSLQQILLSYIYYVSTNYYSRCFLFYYRNGVKK